MLFSMLATVVTFIASHSGPSDHFAAFAKSLLKDGKTVEIYASGPALKKFQENGIDVKIAFSLDNISSIEEDLLAEEIAKTCRFSSFVVTDVGHLFNVKLQKALFVHAPNVFRFAYYDNPEPYVPGGYSNIASKVMLKANKVLFANANLAKASIFKSLQQEIDFNGIEKIGIGYYPINQAIKISKQRILEKSLMREVFFNKNHFINKNQKILVYFGGNNEEYFSKAFPAFLDLLKLGMRQSDFSNLVFLIQQHPGAKYSNIDGNMVLSWIAKHANNSFAPKIFLSDFSSDEAQIIADAALYYQTSMGPQFALSNITTIQVGHETFNDILVKNQLIDSVTNVNEFIDVLDSLKDQKEKISKEVIYKGLGIKENWQILLKDALIISL